MASSVWEGIRSAATDRIEEFRKEVEKEGVASVTTEIADLGDPVDVIENAVQDHGADLVVMGTHGHGGLKHVWLGSVAERTIRKLSCPVLAVKGTPEESKVPIQRILVPVDFSIHSDAAASLASMLAKRFGASLELAHAIDFAPEYAAHSTPEALEIDQKMQSVAAERLDQLVGSITNGEPDLDVKLLRGSPLSVIPKEASRIGADLIVMGTHGHTGLTHLFIGSVTERTLRTAPCSVLAVKATEND